MKKEKTIFEKTWLFSASRLIPFPEQETDGGFICPHTVLTKRRLTLISLPTDNKVAKHCHLMCPLTGLAAEPP